MADPSLCARCGIWLPRPDHAAEVETAGTVVTEWFCEACCPGCDLEPVPA